MSFPDHVDNIPAYVEREDLRVRTFTKFQQFDIAIRIILTHYKNSFVGKSKCCFQIEYDKVNNIPFQLETYNLGKTCEILAKDLHLYTQNYTFHGVHSIQYYGVDGDCFPVHSLTSEEKSQVYGSKGHIQNIYYQFVNNIIVR